MWPCANKPIKLSINHTFFNLFYFLFFTFILLNKNIHPCNAEVFQYLVRMLRREIPDFS